MSGLPPPAGRPATMFPRPDPWLEQARRDAEHRAARRRRRLRVALPVMALLVIGAVVVAAVLATSTDDGATPEVPGTVSTTTTSSTTIPQPTVLPQTLVEVDEVWLIDRGDDVFDWGVSVKTPQDAPRRSGVVIDVRLLDVSGDVVESFNGVVDGIASSSVGAVAGRLAGPTAVPVRIEFDIAVGDESDELGPADLLDVRALERTDDSVTGRVRSSSAEPLDDVTMVLLWHDPLDDVIAAIPVEVERIRPDVEARFEIDLADENVPDGRPDAIVWTR